MLLVRTMNYNTYRLDNGLRIIHLPSTSPIVYCGFAIAVGTRHEDKTQYGMAHFCEHMTFKGTGNGIAITIYDEAGSPVHTHLIKK